LQCVLLEFAGPIYVAAAPKSNVTGLGSFSTAAYSRKATHGAMSPIFARLRSGAIGFSARFCCASGHGVARVGGWRKLGNPGGLNYVADPGGNAGVRWRHELSARNRSRIMFFGGSFADRKF
jgi:hypothetical protein